MTDLDVAPEVAAAVASCRAVVALESTVIAHGLPWPANLELAKRLEQVVRDEGAIPATIAVLSGRIRVGLDAVELEHLAHSPSVRKLTRRDIPVAIVERADGATTVSATMRIAQMAGIRVFSTGGIGGVHRGDHTDVSADLPELARTPMIVVCAGAKAILDLPATLEWLETHGVIVAGWGTSDFPAFFTRTSGLQLETRVEDAAQVAELADAAWRNGIISAVLVTVPAPAGVAMPANRMETAITQALANAEREGIRGKATTPFLLQQVAEISGGESVEANLALLEQNARIAARIASALK
ncbi:MAG TPA: pseudouridine-5'-phosphate glycosidase [Gemmatimonadales bacterium]|nr:pseudouridine-5'-phosphate glycosidase [Gemmatimonadales bacterium]